MLMDALKTAPRDSIVLLEDVDCALSPRVRQQYLDIVESMKGDHHFTCVTLSGLLNAIDGVAAQEGRILFMTTNHRERLDPALIRPGRVDVQIHLQNASKSAAGELFDQFFVSDPVSY